MKKIRSQKARGRTRRDNPPEESPMFAEVPRPVSTISTYSVCGKVRFPDNSAHAARLELYTVYGICRRVTVVEGNRGESVVLRGLFGALKPNGGGPAQEFRAPKANLPAQLAEAVHDALRAIRQQDKRADLQLLFRVAAVRAMDTPAGFEYDIQHVRLEACDPFSSIRDVALSLAPPELNP